MQNSEVSGNYKDKITTKCGSFPAQSARLTDISDPETLSGMAPHPQNIKLNPKTKEIKCEVNLLCMSLHKTWSKAADRYPAGALRAKRGTCSRFEFQGSGMLLLFCCTSRS